MDETKLNIRVYNVGLGDCIYIYVPHPQKAGKENAYHILIDCGSVSPGKDKTSEALKDLRKWLPKNDAKKSHLNLLIISHAHEDHYSGFNPRDGKNLFYSEFSVDRLWMSKLMEPTNPDAKKAREIGELAYMELTKLLSLGSIGGDYSLQINPVLMAVAADLKEKEDLRKKICDELLAHAAHTEYLDTETNSPSLTLFPGDDQDKAKFQVLSPVKEIDKEYLGKGLLQIYDQYKAFWGERKLSLNPLPEGESPEFTPDLYLLPGDGGEGGENPLSEKLTISRSDFRNLYNNLISNSMAFAMNAGHMYNITGLVLLLEWNGYRLLFPGDIEYTPPKSSSKDRGAWNVIWERHLAGKRLLQYVDFLR